MSKGHQKTFHLWQALGMFLWLEGLNYLWIVVGSALYAVGTVLFLFPHALLLGGTSGISVILNRYLPVSPGSFLMIINFSLLILAFFILGKGMAVKTFIGSTLTTLFVGLLEGLVEGSKPIFSNLYVSAVVGALIIAVASGIMFYVDSSSGGTDIIALIVKKFSSIQIGKALLLTDCLIVLVGGLLTGIPFLIGSTVGLLIKTFGIDGVIACIKRIKKDGNKSC